MAADDRTPSAPVGIGQANDPADVRHVQHLLNERQAHGGERLAQDGVFGPRTTARLIEYQRDTVGMSRPDGVADPHGPTMRSLSGQAADQGVGVDAHSTAHPASHRSGGAEGFIQEMLPVARQVHEKWNIPTSVVIGQGAHESQWGQVAPGNEYFGVKAHGTTGPTRKLGTHEDDAKGHHFEKARFRAYGSMAEAGDDYGKFMTSQPRYKHAFEHTDDPHRFVQEIGKAGWGTDPHYAEKVNSIIRHHNLTQYDAPHQAAATSAAPTGTVGHPPAATSEPRVTLPDAKALWAAVAQRGRDAAAANAATAAQAGQQVSAPTQQINAPTVRLRY